MEKEEKSIIENQEEKVEETNVEPNNEECVDISTSLSKEDLIKDIEDRRNNLLTSFKKSRNVSRILMGVVLVAIIGAIILITFNEMVLKIIGYIIAGVVLVGMLVFYFISKNKFPQSSREYIKEVSQYINSYVFSHKELVEAKLYPEKKLDRLSFDADQAYKDIVEVGSRNYIEFKYGDRLVSVNDTALYYQGEDRRRPRKVGFLGKYLSLDNNLKFEGRYVFNLHNSDKEKIIDQPNAIDDLTLLQEDDNLMIYGPEGKEFDKIFDKSFVKELKAINVESPLLNLVVVVWASHTAIYLSYDDPVTTLPFEHPFNADAQKKYQDDLLDILHLLGNK